MLAVFGALTAASLGQAMLVVAINVLVLLRTHSAPAVAGLWIAPQAALLATGTVVGGLTDRWDKRRTLALANLFCGGVAVAMLWLDNLWAVYAALGLFAAVDGAFRSAFGPYFQLLVPPEERTRANAVRGILQYGTWILGPALAGALLVHGRPDTVLACVAGGLALSGALLCLAPHVDVAPVPQDTRTSVPTHRRWAQDLASVTAFLRDHPVAALVILLVNLALAFGGAADAQEVVFAHRALHLANSGYGLLVSTAGVGYVLGAVLSWLVGRTAPVRWLVAAGSVGAAAATSGTRCPAASSRRRWACSAWAQARPSSAQATARVCHG